VKPPCCIGKYGMKGQREQLVPESEEICGLEHMILKYMAV